MPTETAPLHIPTEKLIARLEEVQAEHTAKREERAAKEQARRDEIIAAVAGLSTDQVANILAEYLGYHGDDLIEWVEDKVEREAFVTIEVAPSGIETTLEKQIRVLNLISDKEVEITTSHEAYAYL